MAELVDALVSGTSAARRGGSSPLLGTNYQQKAVQSEWVARLLSFAIPHVIHLYGAFGGATARWHCNAATRADFSDLREKQGSNVQPAKQREGWPWAA